MAEQNEKTIMTEDSANGREGNRARTLMSQAGSMVARAGDVAKQAVEHAATNVKKTAKTAAEFAVDHKVGIAAGTATVGAVAAGVLCAIEKGRTASLSEENEALNGVVDRLANRVLDLEGLCEEKDAYFAETIADGLRHGSPLAGKHMADRRWYLEDLDG